ncbi:hypothetical protein ACFL6C_10245 [Myxococcota bacterium]
MTEPQKAPKRRWRNFLLDTRYQVTFTLPMILIAAALFAGLGYVATRKAESATKIGINQIEQTGAAYLEDVSATRDALLQRERVIKLGIIVVGILLCLTLAIYGIILTHRVAGPLYRLGVELRKLRDGQLAPVNPLRKGDRLMELYEDFRRATEALRNREERHIAVLRRVIEAAQQSPTFVDATELEKLRARLEAKEARLG